jgi:RNA polymerase sigma-70 factor (ECF subfamily)
MSGAGRFETTHWSVVLAAGAEDSLVARHALGTLCEAYWYPLYAYVRRQGYDVDDARDLTQSFFLQLLQREDVHDVRQERGRFRSFLLASLRHFLLNDRVHQRALKRGGGQVVLPLEFEAAEQRYAKEPADTQTPETVFDRRWALTVLHRVFHAMRAEAERLGKAAEFDQLKGCLMGEAPTGGYKAIAARLHVSEGAIKVAVHRLRHRFRRRLRTTIAETVDTDHAIDDEIQYLLKALQG